MLWGWVMRTVVGPHDRTGLFDYLAVRDANRCQIELERARQQAFKDLVRGLPRGAVYREISGDSSREISIPSTPRLPVFVLPVLHHESETGPELEPDW
jgi:hypothetical protein